MSLKQPIDDGLLGCRPLQVDRNTIPSTSHFVVGLMILHIILINNVEIPNF